MVLFFEIDMEAKVWGDNGVMMHSFDRDVSANHL